MNKKISVMCYGDSNTFGYNPADGMRYPEDVRWSGRLQLELGDGYNVIEEGCNGRTTVHDDPLEEWKNGRDYLKPCLNSHKPLDVVVLMLGSNDLKIAFHVEAEEIAQSAGVLVRDIQEFCAQKQGFVPRVILVAPPKVNEYILPDGFWGTFDGTAITKSEQFAACYEKVAQELGCEFMDAAQVVTACKYDGLHLMPEEHAKLAKAVADKVRQ